MFTKNQALKIAQRSNSAVTGHQALTEDRRALIAEALADAREANKSHYREEVAAAFQRNVALVRMTGKLPKGWNLDKETNGLIIGSIGYYLSPKDGMAVFYGAGGNDLRAALSHIYAGIESGKSVTDAVAAWQKMPTKSKWARLESETGAKGAKGTPKWIKEMIRAVGSEILEKGYTKSQVQELLAPFFAGTATTKKATRKAA